MSDLLTIKIADICIGIKPLNEGFNSFCKNYTVDDDPDFVLSAKQTDLDEERERIAEYAELIDGMDFSGLELEKIWVYRQIAETIPKYDAFLIHATSVRVDEDAYLFLGPSGAGKTFHAKVWKWYFKDRMRMINDDKPLIKVTDDEILVCGSPWSGKENWKHNIIAPLKAISSISQSRDNHIKRISVGDSWNLMMNQIYRSNDPNTMRQILCLMDKVINRIPIYEMECNKRTISVKIAYGAMSGKDNQDSEVSS